MSDVACQTIRSCNILRAGNRPHLCSVQRHLARSDQAVLATEADECGPRADDRFGVVVPERRNGPIVRGHAPHQPDGLQIALAGALQRSEEHTSEHQSLMRITYAVLCLKKKK